jgi:adenosylcobinamide-GDP ribazoletransferase
VNALLIITMVVFTGALHVDGFIDTCDGVMVRSSAEERLRIMADSRVGSFGVIGACCLFLLLYVALASVPKDLRNPALIVMPVLSRWAMVYAIFAFPYARKVGSGQIFKKQTNWWRMALTTLITLLISLALAGLSGVALMAALWLIVSGVAGFLRVRLAGLSGDTYGAINEMTAVFTLILLPVLAKTITTHIIGPLEIFDF